MSQGISVWVTSQYKDVAVDTEPVILARILWAGSQLILLDSTPDLSKPLIQGLNY